MKYQYLLIIFSCFIFGCAADRSELEANISSERDSADYQTYSYTLEVEETSEVCSAKDVRVKVTIYVNGKKYDDYTHSFDEISDGETKTKDGTFVTSGRDASDTVSLSTYIEPDNVLFERIHCPMYGTDPQGRPWNGNPLL